MWWMRGLGGSDRLKVGNNILKITTITIVKITIMTIVKGTTMTIVKITIITIVIGN